MSTKIGTAEDSNGQLLLWHSVKKSVYNGFTRVHCVATNGIKHCFFNFAEPLIVTMTDGGVTKMVLKIFRKTSKRIPSQKP